MERPKHDNQVTSIIDFIFPTENKKAKELAIMWGFINWISSLKEWSRIPQELRLTEEDIAIYSSLLRANAHRPTDTIESINTTRRNQTKNIIQQLPYLEQQQALRVLRKISLFVQKFTDQLNKLLQIYSSQPYYAEIVNIINEYGNDNKRLEAIQYSLRYKVTLEQVSTDGIDGDPKNHAKLFYQPNQLPRWKMQIDDYAVWHPLEIIHELVASDIYEDIITKNADTLIYKFGDKYQRAKDNYNKEGSFAVVLSDFIFGSISDTSPDSTYQIFAALGKTD